jgi:hypothetical protein
MIATCMHDPRSWGEGGDGDAGQGPGEISLVQTTIANARQTVSVPGTDR